MPNTHDEFGRYFRKCRKVLGLSLSEFCHRHGFDKGNVSRLERGLTKPPASLVLLESYATALRLEEGSENWKTFMGHAAVAWGKLPTPVSAERAADAEELIRKLGRRLHDSWVKAPHLESWSATREAQGLLPVLIRQLIHATSDDATRVDMPGGDGVQRRGWDGIVKMSVMSRSPFVPEGISGWEISTRQDPRTNADRYFKNREKGPFGLSSSEVTFVFVTSRKWERKHDWCQAKRELRKWKSVEVYDSSDLEAWLELAPGVDAWIAERIGLRPSGIISISDYWESLSRLSEPRFTPAVFLASREKNANGVKDFLLGTTPGVLAIECRSPIEALDFVAAYLAQTPTDNSPIALKDDDLLRLLSRTIIVRDREQWDGLTQASGTLNLLPIPSLSLLPEDLSQAVSRGHKVVVAATEFSNQRLRPISLQRPSRYALEHALMESGFDSKVATKVSRAAGGSVSVLKRQLSVIPDLRRPRWCDDATANDFVPMLLAGAWDDSNDMDRDMLARVSGRPYAELHKTANRLAVIEDAPLTRIESRWRLVSPEDAWSLAGKFVTGEDLDLFSKVAMEVLGQEDISLGLSIGEQFKASMFGSRESRNSKLLCRGIAETVAILGAEFGPVAGVSGAPGQVRANRLVHELLHEASWRTWGSLDQQLPLLAEAAPDEYLSAIRADLEQHRPQLAMLLADGDDEHPLMSSCKHAELLWGLETLAWSPDLLPIVCEILARLAEIDTGSKWGNRPASSLREILLTWYPQTAAGVDERIRVLQYLADSTSTIAFDLLFAMLPQGHSSSMPTHRPVWRDWVTGWSEGTSGADYWKQVNAASELIARLVGTNAGSWSKVLDNLQRIPKSHHEELMRRLQALPVNEMDPEDRRELAEHLRETIGRHRNFAGTNFALPEKTVESLEEALSAMLPEALCERYAWLFVPYLDLESFVNDDDGMETEIQRRRTDALAEILEQESFEGILALAELVEAPGHVGATLARFEQVPDEIVLPGLLGDSRPKVRVLAAEYARERISSDGWDWVRALSLERWNSSAVAILLAQAPFVPETWEFAKRLGETVFQEYWMTVVPVGGSRLDTKAFEFACRQLIHVDRWEAAIGMLHAVTFDKVTVSPETVMEVLDAFLEGSERNPEGRPNDGTIHGIQRLFTWLQESMPLCDDPATRRLAGLEWKYLSILDGFRATPKTLIHHLSDNPEFFAQLIALLFRSSDEQESRAESTERQQKLTGHAYSLLRNWKRVPGIQSDGRIDEDRLLCWLEEVRSRCRDTGHLDVADSQIGEMLASWPKPEDERAMWPCEEICDAIEEVRSDDLERGFLMGCRNSRGVTMRSPLSGGDLERREATRYRRWASLCEFDWPRVAACLKNVAKTYDHDAQREDARAAERALER